MAASDDGWCSGELPECTCGDANLPAARDCPRCRAVPGTVACQDCPGVPHRGHTNAPGRDMGRRLRFEEVQRRRRASRALDELLDGLYGV
jgi:hypothetical protein